MTLGAGIGPYLGHDEGDNDGSRLSGVVSFTATYRISRDWLARVTWHRVITDYDKDSDVILIGAGYNW